jgi:hypothetical protein
MKLPDVIDPPSSACRVSVTSFCRVASNDGQPAAGILTVAHGNIVICKEAA